jgi:hypothetical protein
MLRQPQVGSIQPRPSQRVHDYEIHRVPLGVLILDVKYCELCGCNFLRRVGKDRYCSRCLGGKLGSGLIH